MKLVNNVLKTGLPSIDYLAFASGGDLVIVSDANGEVYLYSQSRDPLKVFASREWPFKVAYSKANNHVAIACRSSIHIIDLNSKRTRYFDLRGLHPSSIAFSSKGDYLVAGYYDGKVMVWDLSGRILAVNESAGLSSINSICFSREDKDIILGTKKGLVISAKANIGQPLFACDKRCFFANPDRRSINSVSCNPFNDYIVSGGNDGTVSFYPNSDCLHHAYEQQHQKIKCHLLAVNAVQYSPNGSFVVSGGDDGIVNIIDGSTLKIIESIRMDRAIDSVAISADGSFFVCGQANGEICFFSSEGKPFDPNCQEDCQGNCLEQTIRIIY